MPGRYPGSEQRRLAADEPSRPGSSSVGYCRLRQPLCRHFQDELRRIWIGAHFGSRGFGHKIATRFLNRAGAKDDMDSAPVALDADGNEGQDYIAAMKLAGRYAYAGRDWVCQRVAKILGARIKEEIHNHHNFAWREKHGDKDYWVVRKGATPAFPGQKGFVGGSMGDVSVIIEGVDNPEVARHSFYSTVHGAGRVMGHMEAKGKVDRKTGEVKRPARVTEEMMMEWVHREGVELRGAGVDESPQCYKRLPEVLGEHEGSIKILHTLKPLGVAMAGKEIYVRTRIERRQLKLVLLTITNTGHHATDLGFLLHKNPANLHSADLAFGKAYVFLPREPRPVHSVSPAGA